MAVQTATCSSLIATQVLDGNSWSIGTRNCRHPFQWPINSIMQMRLNMRMNMPATLRNYHTEQHAPVPLPHHTHSNRYYVHEYYTSLPYLTLPAGWADAQRWDLQCGSSAQPRSARRLSQSLRGPWILYVIIITIIQHLHSAMKSDSCLPPHFFTVRRSLQKM